MKIVETKKTKVISPCDLEVLLEEGVGQWALVAARPSSLWGQRYPALGWEGGNNLIEKNRCWSSDGNCENKKNKGHLTLRVRWVATERCWLVGVGGGMALILSVGNDIQRWVERVVNI